MKNLSYIILLLGFAAMITGCKTDDQMEEALVGEWERTRCPFYSNDDDTDKFWFYGRIKFLSNESLIEDASWAFCKDTCESPASSPMEYCTCRYHVENRCLIISPNADNPEGHFDNSTVPYLTSIPINKVTDRMLILGELEGDGIKIECTCFERR